MLFSLFKHAKTHYILKRYAINHALWNAVTTELLLLQGLNSVERAHLRELSTLFLHEKQFTGIGCSVTDTMKLIISIQACLPVLHLGITLFNSWTSIIIYPTAFHISRDETDADGVVHHNERLLSGEAWLSGPIILSWDDIELDMQRPHAGHNVVIHEIAHKLDMVNGKANGMPPLHTDMSIPQWTAALSSAYAQLQTDIDQHHPINIDPYAVSHPAEFFAVTSELFFCAPTVLQRTFPGVYEQLRGYYRQDPLQRNSG